MNASALDSLRDMGCNISVTSWNRAEWHVQLTLMHGEEFCGHTGRGRHPYLEPALRSAADALIGAACGSACGVDVAELRRIAAGL